MASARAPKQQRAAGPLPLVALCRQFCAAVVVVGCALACSQPISRNVIVVAVHVDADSIVRDETVLVEIEVDAEASSGSGWKDVERRRFRLDPEPIEWPIEFKLDPVSKPAESYSLTATAYDMRGAIVARAQAIRNGARAGDPGLRVHFESACFRLPEVCSGGTTCHRGACVSARDAMPLDRPDAGSNETADGGEGRPPSAPPEGTGQEGDSCESEGERACAGYGTRQPIVCENARWRAAPECAEDWRCDTSPGDQRGSCQPISRECANREANVPFCDSGTMRVCPDLVSSLVRPCGEFRRCASGPKGAECTCEPGYVEDGARCVAATRCGPDRGGCDPLTECRIESGERTCSACPAGYSGSGLEGCAPLLESLSIDAGELEPAFDPAVQAYRVRVPLVVPKVAIAARAPGDTRITFDGAEVANGQPWSTPVLELAERTVELRLATGFGAWTAYTVTLERTGAQVAYVKSSNSDESDGFGIALAASGDRIVSGAYFEDGPAPGNESNGLKDSGAAYVFVRNGESWTQEAYLKADDPAADDFFGTSVALDGDTLVVGAVRSSLLSAPTASAPSGVAYVFTRGGSGWSRSQRLAASNARAGDLFGASVALAGNTLAVGAAYGGEGGGRREGAVYVFERHGEAWSERQIVTPAGPSGNFGNSIAVDGDRMLVGAQIEDGGVGAAYVFVRQGGTWVEEQRLQPDSLTANAEFGFSVSLLGDRAVVGAPYPPPTGTLLRMPPGEVYVFERVNDRWEQSALVQSPTPAQSDYFGASVSLSRTALAIGANGDGSASRGVDVDPSGEAAYSGAAYIFANSGSGAWKSPVYLKANNTGRDAWFGWKLALGSDFLAVAAPRESSVARGINAKPTNNTGANDSGALYVFQ